MYVFGSKTPQRITCRKVRARLRNIKNNQSIDVQLLETPKLSSSMITAPNENIRKDLEAKGMSIADVPITGMESMELGVLIGGDQYWKMVTGKMERLNEGLVALESVFGWLVQGEVTTLNIITEVVDIEVMHISVGEEQALSDQLRNFWEIESLGIHMKEMNSEKEEMAVKLFKENVKFIGERYEVTLPWKDEQVNIASNYVTAKNRFDSLIRRFKNNPTLYDKYNEVIQDYMAQDIVEPVENNETNGPVYYLPHHAVLKEEKATTKLRVVFDASSHEKDSQSLNECLLSGPNLNPDLLGILIKFRQHKIAMMSDIKKAFLQISLNKIDRDVLRFLWTQEKPMLQNEIKVTTLRMTRVPFGVSSSPFLLAATIRHHLRQYEEKYPYVVKSLDECLYVNDYITGIETKENASELRTQAREIMASAGMDLCKWRTNNKDLQAEWSKEDTEEIKTSSLLKVLGLVWRPETDDFIFDMTDLLEHVKDKRPTKRSVLQTTSRIFDPIGFLSPFIIRVKILSQEMWERGLEWDEDLPKDL